MFFIFSIAVFALAIFSYCQASYANVILAMLAGLFIYPWFENKGPENSLRYAIFINICGFAGLVVQHLITTKAIDIWHLTINLAIFSIVYWICWLASMSLCNATQINIKAPE